MLVGSTTDEKTLSLEDIARWYGATIKQLTDDDIRKAVKLDLENRHPNASVDSENVVLASIAKQIIDLSNGVNNKKSDILIKERNAIRIKKPTSKINEAAQNAANAVNAAVEAQKLAQQAKVSDTQSAETELEAQTRKQFEDGDFSQAVTPLQQNALREFLANSDLDSVKTPNISKRGSLNQEFYGIELKPSNKTIKATKNTWEDLLDTAEIGAATNDIRTYLNGVHLDSFNNRLEASDGTMAARIHDVEIPAWLTKQAVKETGRVSATRKKDGTFDDRKFPDLGRVISQPVSDQDVSKDLAKVSMKKLYAYVVSVIKAESIAKKKSGAPLAGLFSKGLLSNIESGVVCFQASLLKRIAHAFLRMGYDEVRVNPTKLGDAKSSFQLNSMDGKVVMVVMPSKANIIDLVGTPFNLDTNKPMPTKPLRDQAFFMVEDSRRATIQAEGGVAPKPVEASKAPNVGDFDRVWIEKRITEGYGAKSILDIKHDGIRATAVKLLLAIEKRDVAKAQDILHPDNKLSRKAFESLLGSKLPKTVKGTDQVVAEFLGSKAENTEQTDYSAAMQTLNSTAESLGLTIDWNVKMDAIFEKDGKTYGVLDGEVIELGADEVSGSLFDNADSPEDDRWYEDEDEIEDAPMFGDDDFDEEMEWDSCDADDDDDIVMDGDFPGHPFRGNQYKKASRQSGSAVHATKQAKKAEKSGDKRALKAAHKSAAYAHKSAAVGATGKAKKYHNKMAKFHAKHGGLK